ncbi:MULTISPECIES: hypothetical protein [Aurantimonas]|uniref:VHL beta domain-containing protein n=1 Tax=Aurantimonas TaxID=182269 RepID=UPI003517AB80
MTGWTWTALAAIVVTAALPMGSASAASCRDFPGLRSQESARSVTVTFVNRTGEYRSVDCLDFDGQPVSYASLNPGESFRVETYRTHPWMLTDGPGNCIEIFMPGRRDAQRFDITVPSDGSGGD